MIKTNIKFTKNSRQAVGGGRIPKNPDIPRKNTNPKETQDKLPPKTK